MSDTRAGELGLTSLARVVATGVSALSPEIMGLGPVEASQRALAHAGMTIDDIALIEVNEAFAAQVLPSIDALGADVDKVNVHGGAIAVGRPFGMTGARITTTLIHAPQERDETFGLETMCVAGGQGMAMANDCPEPRRDHVIVCCQRLDVVEANEPWGGISDEVTRLPLRQRRQIAQTHILINTVRQPGILVVRGHLLMQDLLGEGGTQPCSVMNLQSRAVDETESAGFGSRFLTQVEQN